jgi:RNA polymerase sigma factor (sigma-70 family)
MTQKQSLWEKVQDYVTNFLKVYMLKHYVDQILLHYHDRIMMVVRKYMKGLPLHVIDSEGDDLHTISQLEFLETIKVWIPYKHDQVWPLAQMRMLGAMKDHMRYIARSDPSRVHDWISNAAHLYIGMNKKADFFESFERGDQLTKAMKNLTSREKKVIISHTYQDLTFKTIGERINISESQVSRIYKKALEKVKKEIINND